MKVKIVLPGSGTLFPYYIGFLKALKDLGMEIVHGTYVSGGSIVGCYNAFHKDIKKLEEFLLSINFQDLADYSWNIMDGYGLITGVKIQTLLRSVIGPNKMLIDAKIPSVVLTYNLSRGEGKYWDSTNPYEDVLVEDVIRCSMSIPGVFKYKKIKDDIHIDGGFYRNCPVSIYGDNDEVWALRITPINNTKKPDDGFLEFMSCIANAVTKDNEDNDLKKIQKVNLVEIKSPYSNLDFKHKKEDIKSMIDEGYAKTISYFSSKSKNVKI